MKTAKCNFGTLGDGTKVKIFTVSNGRMSFSATEFGCTITSILLPNVHGWYDDIVLGYSTLDDYIRSPDLCFGTIVGRFANRIGNAEFLLGKEKYKLDKNDNGKNCLHSGFSGYHKMVWQGKPVCNKHGCGVRFTRTSLDGEQGFPGNLLLTVTYFLDDDNNLSFTYEAKTDRATPINITNHTYFNLAGSGNVVDEELQIFSKYYLEKDSYLIPTGKFCKTEDTPYDFMKPQTIATGLASVKSGYDDCYVTPAYDPEKKNIVASTNIKGLFRAAVVSDKKTDRTMTIDTNQEGMQVYTANWIDGIVGKKGRIYHAHDAVCLETQCFPDSPNKADFPSCILNPSEKYKAVTVYGFKF